MLQPAMVHHGRLLAAEIDDDEVLLTLVAGGRLISLRIPSTWDVPAVGTYVSVEVEEGRATAMETFGGLPSASSADLTRWWRPYAMGSSRMERLQQRARAVRAIRNTLDSNDFLEVQSPLLLRATCPDVHIDSFAVGRRYLATSTEYQLKRMFAGGFEKVYSLAQNFREGDIGPRHNDEFTMLEWARAYESMTAIERDAQEVVKSALAAIDSSASSVVVAGREVVINGVPWERITVREALLRHIGVEVGDDFSLEDLQSEVRRLDLQIPPKYLQDRTDLVTLLIDRVQEHLGTRVPTFLVEWPSFLTTSAPLLSGKPTLAERSELFIGGIEIADGFPFLRDATLQRRLFEQANVQREALGKPRLENDERYLEALEGGLPPGAGMALGVDRLIMVLTGADHIREVLAFAAEEL